MTTNWIFSIGNAIHFDNSAPLYIWGIKSLTKTGNNSTNAKFIREAKEGDKLWFIKSKTAGRVYAVATFTHTMKREIGPLIALTRTSDELGWTKDGDAWDTEVHYKYLYKVIQCDIHLQSRCPQAPISYTVANDKYGLDWEKEHSTIQRYSKATPIKRKRPLVASHNPYVITVCTTITISK